MSRGRPLAGFNVGISGTGASVQLVLDIPTDTWSVVADPAEFETALVNLVINARDAMPKGGTVTVSAKNLHLADGSDHVEIAVADCGEGIPAGNECGRSVERPDR